MANVKTYEANVTKQKNKSYQSSSDYRMGKQQYRMPEFYIIYVSK